MVRGEIRAYQALSRVRNVLIVSADPGQHQMRGGVDVTDVMPTSENVSLSMRIALGDGLYAKCLNISRVNPDQLRELKFTVDPSTMHSIDNALRRLLVLPWPHHLTMAATRGERSRLESMRGHCPPARPGA